MTQVSNHRLHELQADLCSTMANATRLAILECLHTGEKNVTDITDTVGATITAVSQHLRVLRDKHVVLARKDGQTVFYRLRDRRMIEACHLIRAVLTDGMKEEGDLVRRAAPRPRSVPDQRRRINGAAVGTNVSREAAERAAFTLGELADPRGIAQARKTAAKSKRRSK